MSRSFFTLGQRAWSYQTCIRDVLPDGRTIGNVTHYSPTTTGHQIEACVSHCDVLVSDVPKGTEDLAAWFLGDEEEKKRRAAGAERPPIPTCGSPACRVLCSGWCGHARDTPTQPAPLTVADVERLNAESERRKAA